MQYKGKLFGKVNDVFFPLLQTTDDFEKIEKQNIDLLSTIESTVSLGNSIHTQLQKEKQELINEIEQLILCAEEDKLYYSELEHARKLVFKMTAPKEYNETFNNEKKAN